MMLKMLSVVIACNFLNSANALYYEIDDQQIHGPTSLAFADPDKIYSLKNNSSKVSPSSVLSFGLSEKLAPNGKFMGSNLTFEEQTLLVGHSPSCINVKDNKLFIFDSSMPAIKSRGDIRVFGNRNSLQLNNCTIISDDGNITFQGARVQGNVIFKTPNSKSLNIIPDRYYEGGINGIVLTPYSFNFVSKTGMSLPSSSAYISVDIDFAKNNYDISFQCVGNLTLTDKPLEFIETKGENYDPSPRRKKIKTEDLKN